MAEYRGDRVGQQLGPYRLTRLLGEGGFGEVYEADHRLLQQKRAIKLLLERYFHDANQRERFLREARTLATLEHPNILPVLEVGEEGNILYLVMPLYYRGTLNDFLKQRTTPLPLAEVERPLGVDRLRRVVAVDILHALQAERREHASLARGRGVVEIAQFAWRRVRVRPLGLVAVVDARRVIQDRGLALRLKFLGQLVIAPMIADAQVGVGRIVEVQLAVPPGRMIAQDVFQRQRLDMPGRHVGDAVGQVLLERRIGVVDAADAERLLGGERLRRGHQAAVA